MSRPRKPSPVKPHQDWEAKDALHTLTRAEEIKSDPKLMAKVREHAQHHRQALAKIARAPRAK